MLAKPAPRNWVVMAAVTLLVTWLCVAYIDRPLAEFFDLHFRHTYSWKLLRAALLPLGLIAVAAMVFLFTCGGWVMCGRQLSPSARIATLCSWATMWAIAVETILKFIFGRGWTDPTYVQDRLYGFHLLQGFHEHWNSFPSGTALASAAIGAVLWIERPSWRRVVVVAVIVVCAAMVVTNLHWLGDMLPGIFLGAAIGSMTVGLNPTGERTR